MTDAKGDRSQRPHQQANPDTYVHIVDRHGTGIVISGTKAIVTSAPYVHELLVLPGRAMTANDRDFAIALCRMAIADREQPTRNSDRQIQCAASDKFFTVHVSASHTRRYG